MIKTLFTKSNLIALASILSIPLLGLIYQFLNRPQEKVYSLVTSFDQQTPLLKIFVIPYMFWYAFVFITLLYLMFKNRKVYYETLLQYNLGLLICYSIYIIYQTHVPRPVVEGNDFLSQMLQWIYQSDAPYNCFPSIHVLTTYVVMRAVLKITDVSRLVKILTAVMAFLIIASTVFIRQHVILDIVGAVLVVEGLMVLTLLVKQSRRREVFVADQRIADTSTFKTLKRGA
ncbi:membrane-associated phospholipid phosphatase [Croceifilum oryzae]|uniref:Membrane-associated phospholipid phosphatase n=1 Tax=Croceifilum oryzae TaxID=1553429 RepID=A0AAJ1TIE1_9BACL|nr:phosphatase PAP2 family protein [Croceifilum oryzae]MDQ0416691.1 membrane-associated phospholipid phosphatase [Croceifilum oryzae]